MTHRPEFMVCVDAVVLDVGGAHPQVLAVRRQNPPCANQWVLPGGRVEPGEHPDTAAARELFEETGLKVPLRPFAFYGAPGRDPRGPTISLAYLGIVSNPPQARYGENLTGVAWLALPDLELGFDHSQIVRDACRWGQWTPR